MNWLSDLGNPIIFFAGFFLTFSATILLRHP
jgi:hypothetical protein